MRKFLVLALLFAVLAAPVLGLDIGDKAPAIAAETWVTGEPADPTAVDDKTIYMVEVWSVTCPPCVQTIPILNDLQKRYADQGFKIVSFTSDALDDVKPFLDEHPMEYSSFIDKDGASTVNYMAADNRNTIPHAFLFDRSGRLVWIGNPLDNLESRLKQVIDGTLDVDRALAIRDAMEDFQTSYGMKNIDGMVTALKQLEVLEPDAGQYFRIHYSIIAELGFGDEGEAAELLKTWYAGAQDQAESLVALSVAALDQGPPSYRNPEMALAAAKRAYAIDGATKIETGLNLAETYKNVGRVDRALEIIGELTGEVEPENIEALTAIETYYHRLVELGKNPDAEYTP